MGPREMDERAGSRPCMWKPCLIICTACFLNIVGIAKKRGTTMEEFRKKGNRKNSVYFYYLYFLVL